MCFSVLLVAGCSLYSVQKEQRSRTHKTIQNSFALSVQTPPPPEIQSLQLHPENAPSAPPVLYLNKPGKLILKFDHLNDETRQFTVQIRHYSKNWQVSSIPPEFYLDGFDEDYVGGGSKSVSQNPSYRHYRYSFPNQILRFKSSGNYLISVYDYDSGKLLFSLPFFVAENAGTIKTRTQKLFAQRDDLRELEIFESDYRYPDFIEFPRFDLSFFFVQNQFWGRTKEATGFDVSDPGRVHFYLAERDAFLGDYEFRVLDLNGLRPDGKRILTVEHEFTPPNIILQRDVRRLDKISPFFPSPQFGLPRGTREAAYANVRFSLDAGESLSPDSQLFIIGGFSGWRIQGENRMTFDRETGLWEGTALVKDGEYAYKYVVLDGNTLDDLRLDHSFTFTRQQYTVLIYFRDPVRLHDRLIQIQHVTS